MPPSGSLACARANAREAACAARTCKEHRRRLACRSVRGNEGTLLSGCLVATVEEDIGGERGGGYTETLRRSAKKTKHPRFLRAGVQQISRPISGSYFVAANAAHMQLAPESSHQPQFVCCAFKQRGSSPCNYASLSISFPTSLRDFIAAPFPFFPVF